jgi:hypothetical protein
MMRIVPRGAMVVQANSNEEQTGTASIALVGSAMLYFGLPLLISAATIYVLFTLPERFQKGPVSTFAASAINSSEWLNATLLPAPLWSDSAVPDHSIIPLDTVRNGYAIFVTFLLYYACFTVIVFIMLFRLIIGNWRNQTRTGAFSTERLRGVFGNLRELVFVLGFPALIVYGFGFPGADFVERKLFAWTAIPGIEVPRWQFYLLIMAVCLHIVLRWERAICFVHTLMYQARFWRTIRVRRVRMRELSKTLHMEYVPWIGCYYNICWKPHPITGWPQPHWRSEWYTKGKPGAHPIYDVWKCGVCYAANIIRGRFGDNTVHVFDYHYCRDVVIHWGASVFDYVTERMPRDCTIAAMELPVALPSLSIFPATVWDELAKWGGGPDVGMESIEFTGAYRVWAHDRRFAFAVCNAQMMAFLSDRPGLALRIAGNVLALRTPELVPVEEMVQFRESLIVAHGLIPEFVFVDAKCEKNS